MRITMKTYGKLVMLKIGDSNIAGMSSSGEVVYADGFYAANINRTALKHLKYYCYPMLPVSFIEMAAIYKDFIIPLQSCYFYKGQFYSSAYLIFRSEEATIGIMYGSSDVIYIKTPHEENLAYFRNSSRHKWMVRDFVSGTLDLLLPERYNVYFYKHSNIRFDKAEEILGKVRFSVQGG